MRHVQRPQRRSAERLEIDLPVTYRVSGVQGIARMVSLSPVGCTITGVTADASFYLELSITVPGAAAAIKAGAGIRWRRGQTLGLEFLILSKSDEEVLSQFLRR